MARISNTAGRRAKITSVSNRWVERTNIWNLWNVFPISDFMLNYGNISQKPLSTISCSMLKPWGRKRAYVQLLEIFHMVRFHAQIWQFGNGPVSRKPRPMKISSRENLCATFGTACTLLSRFYTKLACRCFICLQILVSILKYFFHVL